MGRDSMIFYRSFYESGMLLRHRDRLLLFEAILGYQFGGEMISLPDTAMAAWVLIKPILESNNQRYENGQKGKESGAKGGRPKQINPGGDTNNSTDINPTGVFDEGEKETPNKDKEEDKDKDNNKDEEEEGKKNLTPLPRKKYGAYKNVKLTDADCDKLKAEFPSDWDSRIERLSEYIAQKGDKYKNHLAVIRSWAKKDMTDASASPPKGTVPHSGANPFLRMLREERE